MSAIKEKTERAGAPGGAPRPALTVKAPAAPPAWLTWLMLFFVLAEGMMYLRERGMRLDAEEKMRLAYLELNDARNEYIARSASAIHAEFETLSAQKRLSDLTKKMHETEMARLQLEEELRARKTAETASK